MRDTARRFVEEEFQPLIVEAYRQGTFPMQLVPRIAELGFLGSTLPEEYGCAGVSNVAYGLIAQELERGDSGLRSFASVQSSLGDVSHLHVRLGGAARGMAAAHGRRHGDRLLRSHGARLRLEPDRDAHQREARARRLRAERREALDHQRRTSPTSRWSGRGSTTRSTASWSRRTAPASRRRRCTASSACARRSPPSCTSRIAGSQRRTACPAAAR